MLATAVEKDGLESIAHRSHFFTSASIYVVCMQICHERNSSWFAVQACHDKIFGWNALCVIAVALYLNKQITVNGLCFLKAIAHQ